MFQLPTTCYFSDMSPLQRTNELDHVDMIKTTDVFSKQYQLPKVSTGLNKQVDISQANSNYNINLNAKYSRHNNDSIDQDSIDAKIIVNISIQNTSRDKYFRHGKLLIAKTKNSTIGFDYTASKEHTSVYR